MSNHTPGPWNIRDGFKIYGEGSIIDSVIHVVSVHNNWTSERAEADARLIAAAPETAAERDKLKEVNAELLAALKDCLSWNDDADKLNAPIEVRAAYMRARAAIAKAEGRS